MPRFVSCAAWLILALGFALFPTQEPVKRSDAELKAMAKIQQLGGLAMELAQNDSRLDVSYQQVDKFNEDSLSLLKDMKDLAHLNLRGLNVTDRGLTNLKGLTSLTRLHLELTKISDKGLENIKDLANLEYLNLYGTAITDAGLVHLRGLKKLKNLYLWQTKVTDTGVAELKKALPHLEIVRGLDLDKPKTEQLSTEKKPQKKPEPKAEAKPPEQVDDVVKVEMQKQKIPGLSLIVLKDGKIVKAEGYGLANVELSVPATPKTVYQSGSMGKQFVATLVMMLVEESKLKLEDKIGKYLPGSPETWKDITIRHLLTHTSGVKNYGPLHLNFRKDYSDDQLVQIAAKLPLDFPPGEKWSYSNTGYVLLGIIINNATGKFYGDLLKEKIFGPLGMETARIISEADVIPNRAAGYRLVAGNLKNQEYVSPSLNRTADGSLYFTVLDLAKWDAALYTEKLLKRATLEQMWTPVKLNNGKTHPYGFGWALGNSGGKRFVRHGGAWQGFVTFIVRHLDDKVTVAVLANRAGANPGAIADRVARFYLPSSEAKAQAKPTS
jgi:CubicO group peptidase (beta-lactamase class C family)